MINEIVDNLTYMFFFFCIWASFYAFDDGWHVAFQNKMHVCVKSSSHLNVNTDSHARRICLYLSINMSHMWRFGRSLSKASGQNICQSYNEQICFLFFTLHLYGLRYYSVKYSLWYFIEWFRIYSSLKNSSPSWYYKFILLENIGVL